MTQNDVTAWEIENAKQIMRWEIDYASKPSVKIITFEMSDKSKINFEIPWNISMMKKDT